LSGASYSWVDLLRSQLLAPSRQIAMDTIQLFEKLDPPKTSLKSPPARTRKKAPHARLRILVLPGIMGSLLHDRSGKLNLVWIDPWNLVFGDDFDELKLRWEKERSADRAPHFAEHPLPLPERIPDADDAVLIEACGAVPIIYDLMALALLREFGPVVEFAPYDWRQPIRYLGQGLASRIKALLDQHPALQIALVAHSMGGLVAADALTQLKVAYPAALDAIKALVVLGTPFLGSFSALKALRAEQKGMGLLKLLGRKSAREIANVVQSLWGLVDLLPGDQEELLRPAVFEPGPLSHLPAGDARLNSPLNVVRSLPAELVERTRAIVCTTRQTIGSARVREDGSIDYSEMVGGDGTVTAKSALGADMLLAHSLDVNQGHTTLPLDRDAIRFTLEWIGLQLGVDPSKSITRDWPAGPEIDLPTSRGRLRRHLEADDGLTLGDFVALMSLA